MSLNGRDESSDKENLDTQCSICLGKLTNKCNSDSCVHTFCFECLKQWSATKSCCPLCRNQFKGIFHSFNGQGLYETYVVPTPVTPLSPDEILRSHWPEVIDFTLDFLRQTRQQNPQRRFEPLFRFVFEE